MSTTHLLQSTSSSLWTLLHPRTKLQQLISSSIILKQYHVEKTNKKSSKISVPLKNLFLFKEETSMALQANAVAFCLVHQRLRFSVKAVASENVSILQGNEEKVKLGGSDLRVTKLGVGAWSWGDTTYWNDFQWNGDA